MTLVHTHNSEARTAYIRAFAQRRKREAEIQAAIQEDERRKRRCNYQPAGGTLPAMILDAIRNLIEPFTLTDIVLACWREYQTTFSLEDCLDHPDSRKVSSYIMGKRGLVARGLLRKQGQRYWRVAK